jgi:D-inositol-3-phosphate glycosyltransferase
MACGVHQIVSDWSALGEWASGAADLIPCSDTAIGPPYVNVIGGVLDGRLFVEALHSAYLNWRETGHSVDQVSLDRAASSKFRWENIGQGYMRVLKEVLP